MSVEKILQLIQKQKDDFYSALPEVLKLLCIETSASRCNFWYVKNGFLYPVYNYDVGKDDFTSENLQAIDINCISKYYKLEAF